MLQAGEEVHFGLGKELAKDQTVQQQEHRRPVPVVCATATRAPGTVTQRDEGQARRIGRQKETVTAECREREREQGRGGEGGHAQFTKDR